MSWRYPWSKLQLIFSGFKSSSKSVNSRITDAGYYFDTHREKLTCTFNIQLCQAEYTYQIEQTILRCLSTNIISYWYRTVKLVRKENPWESILSRFISCLYRSVIWTFTTASTNKGIVITYSYLLIYVCYPCICKYFRIKICLNQRYSHWHIKMQGMLHKALIYTTTKKQTT